MTRDRLATVVPRSFPVEVRRSMEVHKVLCLPRSSQSTAPATQSAHRGSQRAVPATKSAHGGSQSAAPATKSAHGGSQSAAPATQSAHRGSQSAAPATNSAHGGSQSAVPATNSAHGGSQSAAPATKSAHGGSQSAAPAKKSALQETSENSNHNGGTIPTMIRENDPSMTRDRLAHVVPQSLTCKLWSHPFYWKTQHFVRPLSLENAFGIAPATKSAPGGSQSAVPATNSAHGGFTKCCACHETCTWS